MRYTDNDAGNKRRQDGAMEQFDRQKFKAMLHYVIHRCRPDRLGRTKLHKVAFHADMLWYLEAGRPLTGETYVKQPRGPVAYHMTSCIDELVKSGAVRVSTVNYYGYAKYEYTALLPPPAGPLSVAEAKLLDDMIDFVCEQNTAASISELSHTEAWHAAQMGEELPYFAAMELLDGAGSLPAVGRRRHACGAIGATLACTGTPTLCAREGVLQRRRRLSLVGGN